MTALRLARDPAKGPFIGPIALANLLTLAAVAIWALASLSVPAYLLPGPVDVAKALAELVTTWNRARHILITIAHVASAIAATVILASVLALLLQMSRTLNVLINERINPFLNSFSGYGWVLLFMIWIGINSTTVVASVTVVLLPLALTNLVGGLKAVDRDLIEMVDSFHRSAWTRLRLVIIPTLAPFFLAALRGCFGLAWKIVLTAELFGGNGGLGYVVNRARQDFDTATIFACIVVAIVIVRVGEVVLGQWGRRDAPLGASGAR